MSKKQRNYSITVKEDIKALVANTVEELNNMGEYTNETTLASKGLKIGLPILRQRILAVSGTGEGAV